MAGHRLWAQWQDQTGAAQRRSGTGWVVKTGMTPLIVTAFHVVGFPKTREWLGESSICTPGTRYMLEVNGANLSLQPLLFDAAADVALLKADSIPNNVAALPLGNEFSQLQWWSAQGFPQLVGDEITVIGRATAIDESLGRRALDLFVQEGTQVGWHGLSGSAVVSEGHVVGVITEELFGTQHLRAASVTSVKRLLALYHAARRLQAMSAGEDASKLLNAAFNPGGLQGARALLDKLVLSAKERAEIGSILCDPVPLRTDGLSLVAGTLFPRGELLDDGLFASHATCQQVRRYYSGGAPAWQVLAAGALIERDRFKQLYEKLCEPSSEARLICIVGEPGSGKSSLAWQAAQALFRESRRPVLRFTSDHPDYLASLPRFYKTCKQPFFVLIDNTFKKSEALSAIKGATWDVPVTVLTTCRSNEYRRLGLATLQQIRFDLGVPSLAEKHKLVAKVGRQWFGFNYSRRKAIEKNDSLLFLIYELTRGHDDQNVAQIIKDIADELQSRDTDAYDVYRYVCISWQFEVSAPRSFVERLVPRWAEEEIDALLGLVSENEDVEGTVQAQHPELAKLAVQTKGWKTNGLLNRIPGGLNSKDSQERKWLLHLAQALAESKDKAVLACWLTDQEEWLRQFSQHESIAELSLWHSVYAKMGLGEEAAIKADLAFSRHPASDEDWRSLILLAKVCRYPPSSLATRTLAWLQDHPTEWLYRSIYLEAVERHRASISELKEVLDQMMGWLEQPDQNILREHLLRVVRDYGSEQQAFRAIECTANWLASPTKQARPSDEREVRTAYLRLVRKCGTPAHVVAAIKDGEQWLKSNPDDVRVREPFIALVREHGRRADWRRTINTAEQWLRAHDNDQNVRLAFINLVRRRGASEDIARAVKSTGKWLSAHAYATPELKSSYSQLLARSRAKARTHPR